MYLKEYTLKKIFYTGLKIIDKNYVYAKKGLIVYYKNKNI